MTTEEQIYQNRAAAEIVRYFGRNIGRLCRVVGPNWNLSIEWGPGVSNGFNPVVYVPGALEEFNKMVTALRAIKPGLAIRCDAGAQIVPVSGKTLVLFPPIAAAPAPPVPPTIDNVPDPNKLPPVCTICGEKIYIA